MDDEPTKSLCVREGWGVCCNQEVDEVLYRLRAAASCSQALVVIGNLNHPDIFRRDNRAKHKLSRRFLKCMDDNFLIEKPMRRGALLDPQGGTH